MATVAEVAPDIFRINLAGPPIDVSFFVIRDEQPALVETGWRRSFADSLDAVRRVLDPATLRYLVVPHFEGDECGALNHFLNHAPNAVPLASPIGVATSLGDFALREPLPVDADSVLDLGQHKLRFLIAPYVHQWDSMLPWEQTTRTVFTSDVFITPSSDRAVSDADETDGMLAIYREVGIFPSRAHLDAALDKLEATMPATLACHHGSVKGAKLPAYLRALREQDVTGLTEWNPMREAAA
jgi:flavorubredoxin